jgi:hypothetical protein
LGVFTDPALKGYRALWLYLAGSAAWLAFNAGRTGFESVSRQYFEDACKACPGVPWLYSLQVWSKSPTSAPVSDGSAALIERIEVVLDRLGTQHDRAFAAEEKRIREGLATSEFTVFEEAHKALGTLLGYEADRGTSKGVPDGWWEVDNKLCFVFEDHSEAKPESSLGVVKARQASSHVAWAFANLPLDKDATIIPILISPVAKIDRDARPHVEGLRYWNLEAFRKWALSAIATIREVRKTYTTRGDVGWREAAWAKLRDNRVSVAEFRAMLDSSLAKDLPS